MSIIMVTDSPARGGGWKSERRGPVLELTNRLYKRTLIVQTDDIDDGPQTVLQTVKLHGIKAVPQIGDEYQLGNDDDDIAVCIDVKCEPLGDFPLYWKVEATYDSSRIVDINLSNPLNLPPEITWNFTQYEWPLQRDAMGVAVVNSSGERFDPPPTVELKRPVLVITRNEPSYNEYNALVYIDACNSDVFGIALPYQAKIANISAQLHIDIGIQYWRITYEIEFQARTFAYFLLDQGFRDADGKLFRDPVDFTPLANPTLLNGRGFRQVDTYAALSGAIAPYSTLISVQNPPGYSGSLSPGQYFPPGPSPGSPQSVFEVMIDAEILQVTGGFGTNTWLVTRGFAGTVPAAHGAGAIVQLQPYFLRFLPHLAVPFAPLNLPIEFATGQIRPWDAGGSNTSDQVDPEVAEPDQTQVNVDNAGGDPQAALDWSNISETWGVDFTI